MRTINLPVSQKDKSDLYLEAVHCCEILSRGNDWILVQDKEFKKPINYYDDKNRV